MEILEQCVKEVSETGRLSFPARRALWLALGAWEERDERDNSFRKQGDSRHRDSPPSQKQYTNDQ